MERRLLHLRSHPNESWQRYTAFRQFAVPDYNMPGGSKGWATVPKIAPGRLEISSKQSDE